MSAACEIALAVGLTLFGACNEPTGTEIALPSEDESAFSFEREAPPPPPSAPEPSPVFPPVIVEKEVVRIIEKAPPPPPRKKEPPKPDPIRVWLESRHTLRDKGVANATPRVLTASVAAPDADLDFSGIPEDPIPDLPHKDEKSKRPEAKSEFDTYGFARETSTGPVDNTRIVAADRYITGVLETGVNSQIASSAGGRVVIQTARDVFGYHDRKILIPKGSRLLCDYESPTELGVSRLAVQCKRILVAEHRAEITQLSAPVGNVQGHAGMTGEVDNRFLEKYGTALMLATTSGVVQGLTAYGYSRPDADVNSVTNIIQNGTAQVTDQFGQITASVLEETVNLAPIIIIPQGTRVQIRPEKDWYLTEWETS